MLFAFGFLIFVKERWFIGAWVALSLIFNYFSKKVSVFSYSNILCLEVMTFKIDNRMACG